jgi:orotidine-5'-phosphate decarboxylase
MEKTAETKKSSIILALDFPFQEIQEREILLTKAKNFVDIISPFICAVKINHHLVLPLGTFNGVQTLVKSAHDKGLLTIMDCKVNDIGSTNQVIADYYYEAGFDAIIANPFVGWEDGLKPVFDSAYKHQRGVILLNYMSHKGALEGYGQTICDNENRTEKKQYIAFAQKALSWKADGVVVGATVPEKIKEIYDVLGEKVPIYSPGVGAQGGAVEAAVKAGARYLIVGREIMHAENPAEKAEKLNRKAESI